MPSDVFEAYLDFVDEDGIPHYFEVDFCPLAMVDHTAPGFDPGPLADIMAASRSIAAGVPDSWVLQNPTDALTEGVVLLKSEVDSAAHFRMSKDEDW